MKNNEEKAEVLNEYFANAVGNLVKNVQTLDGNFTNIVNKVTPTIMKIEISEDDVKTVSYWSHMDVGNTPGDRNISGLTIS